MKIIINLLCQLLILSQNLNLSGGVEVLPLDGICISPTSV